MLPHQKDYYQKFLTELHILPLDQQAEKINTFVKKEKRTFIHILDSILLGVILVFMVFMYIDGEYISKEIQIHEVCDGIPTEGIDERQFINFNLEVPGNDRKDPGEPQESKSS